MKKRKRTKKSKKLNFKSKMMSSQLLLVAGVFAVVGVATLIYTSAAGRNPKASSVATFTHAANQASAWGSQINELKYYDGKIYAGYGDWNANTGPVHMLAYNISSGEVDDEFTFGSEASHWMNVQNGKLYVPAIDKKGADLAIKENGVWRSLKNIGSAHLFAAMEYGGKTYVSGQKGNVATIWSSSDNGASWQIEVQDITRLRFHFIAELDGKIYTEGTGRDSVTHVLDPSTGEWSQQETMWGGITMGFKAEKFKDRIVGLNWYPIGEDPYNSVYSFDGNSSSYLCGCYDFTVSGDYLYALRRDGVVMRTKDFTGWEDVAQASGGGKNTKARSVEVYDGVVYIGTSDSQLQAVRIDGTSSDGGGGSNNGQGKGRGGGNKK